MRFTSLALGSLLAAALAMGGCFGDGYGGPGTGGAGGSGGGGVPPRTLDIDTNATVTAKGGLGVGIFFEYAAGGLWTVYTTCDTSISQGHDACDIDVFVAPVDASASITSLGGMDFQGVDEVDVDQNGLVHMFVETTTGLDGMTFTATPGATMAFDVALDGVERSQFLYWIGDGVLHAGSPTDPVNFTPVVAPLDGGAGSGGAGGAGTGGTDAGGADAGTDGG